jgi:serine/threonine-protein kinase
MDENVDQPFGHRHAPPGKPPEPVRQDRPARTPEYTPSTHPTPGYTGEPPAPSEGFRVALVGATAVQPARELAEQLRKRLLFVAVVAAAGFAGQLLLRLAFYGRESPSAPVEFASQERVIISSLVLAVLESGAVLLLAGRRAPSLARLRLTEILVFAPVAGYFVQVDIVYLRMRADVIPHDRFIWANATTLPFALVMAGYGVLIPNTWRRCVVAVGLIAALACVGPAVAFMLSPQPADVVLSFFAQKAIWLGIAGSLIGFGAYRIEVLQRQALRGRELGQYRLGQLLGTGGMGEVYLAEHLLLRRPAAIKLIRPEHAGDPVNLARFEREVHATATLTHPNTVQIYDYGRADDGTFYCVMEYLPGLTLRQLIKEYGPLSAARAVYFLRQICGALCAAHAVGLIHRDIKPANVMVCERGGLHDTVKVLDFGLVLPLSRGADGEKLTEEGALPGTPAYMSPEQAAGEDDLDPRSDIYGVGALAYFLLTGQPPFAGRSPLRMLAAHLYEPPEPPSKRRPDLPADLEAIVLRCLAKEPADRFADAQSLESALAVLPAAGQWSAAEAAAWWGSRVSPAPDPSGECR